MAKFHTIENAIITDEKLQINIDGQEYSFDLKQHSRLLNNATREQIQNFVISPSGYGIHWPDLDEDLSIDGLMGITHMPPKMKAVV